MDPESTEYQCARCGSSAQRIECDNCDGTGLAGHDCGEDCCACLEPDDNMSCEGCDGAGSWRCCVSSQEWCEANPLPGREEVGRGELETFEADAPQERP